MNSSRFDPATIPQISAANPERTSWVSANAGSGKTRVLTHRVARLLLRGTQPQQILCLTFTKSAANNMVMRLIEILGSWSMLPDSELTEKLLDLGEDGKHLTQERLNLARTLFAKALETPGGMKIQTIHSFATRLLRNFPLEADISPQFTVIDDRKCAEIYFEILNTLSTEQESLIGEVGTYASFDQILKFCESIAFHRELIPSEVDQERIWNEFSVPEEWNDEMYKNLFRKDDLLALNQVIEALKYGSVNERRAYEKLNKIDYLGPSMEMAQIIEGIFLYGPNTKNPFKRKPSIFTKSTLASITADLDHKLVTYGEVVEDYNFNQRNYLGAKKTLTFHRFAQAFLNKYQDIKSHNAWLDYDDLLRKASEILSDPEIAPWILFRLDENIDHILVDEAQDISPMQWDIVARIAEEFSAGHGQKDNIKRTVFAVGDEKQSIYGFQKAEPERFQIMRDHFKNQFEDFNEQELAYSFRSSQAILDVVDKVISICKEGLPKSPIKHIAFKSNLPGRVDLWPRIPRPKKKQLIPWESRDYLTQNIRAEIALARNIVQQIKHMLDHEFIPVDGGSSHRRVEPKDILILVPRRSTVYHTILAELQTEQLPIAGTDRMNLIEDLAVQDLLALLGFLSVPKDSLSLASLLKSPLFGFNEQDIFALMYHAQFMHGHTQSLWEVLLTKSNDKDKYRRATQLLSELMVKANSETPYAIMEEVLTVHSGRKLFKSRLGERCVEAIDALLYQALEFEKTEVISLTNFLEWLNAEKVAFKRQLSQDINEIRVMTIHGAKGLESPIVILPDTDKRNLTPIDQILIAQDGFPIWKTLATYPSQRQIEIINNIEAKELEERNRLLYVALTRSESWLIVCGIGREQNNSDANPSWYTTINNAFSQIEGVEQVESNWDEENNHFISRYSVHQWPEMTESGQKQEKAVMPILPQWMETPVEPESFTQLTLSPSNLGGAKVIASDSIIDQVDDQATERGSAIHLLLEHLPQHPPHNRLKVAESILQLQFPELSSSHDQWKQEVLDILDRPELKFLFLPSSLTEVAIAAEIKELGPKTIYGFIDRLIFEEDSIMIVDYKSNQVVPKTVQEVPEGLLRQMEAYRRGLMKIYPNTPIKTAILWTKSGELMTLPKELTLQAFQRIDRVEDNPVIH